MKITWLGHAAVKIEGSRTIFIDPFLSGNPAASLKADAIEKADIVVVTHDHGDHLGDSYSICKRTGATLVSIFEIADAAAAQGIAVEKMNVGGTVTVHQVEVSLVPAFHTAGLGGTAVGAVIGCDGKTLYHAGDTGLTLEMKLIAEMYRPDVAFLPIDGRFNMTPRLAAKAVELLNVSRVVPIHYDTFPAVKSSPEVFSEMVGDRSEVIVLRPGESFEL